MKKIGFIVFTVLLFIGNNAIATTAEKGRIIAIVQDDFLKKKPKTEYFFQKKDLSLVLLELENIGNSLPRPGQRAILSPSGKLHYSKNKAGITFNKISGEKKILIVLIQPSDEDIPWEAEKAEEYFQSSKDFLEDSHQHSKINKLSIETIGWLKSKKTKSQLTSSKGTYPAYDEAINLTDGFINYNEVDCLFVVVAEDSLNWTWNWAEASLGEYVRQTNDEGSKFSDVFMGSGFFSNSPMAISHELGHALLSFYHGGGENVSRENECGYSGSKVDDYKDFDVMGNKYYFFSAFRQYMAGWLLEERVTTLSSSASVELHPREIANSDGKQLIIIKISDDEFYTLELCVKELESYNDNDSNGDGLLLRHHDGASLPRDDGSWYDSVVFLQENNDNESFLHPGEKICGLGKNGDISIKYVSLGGEGEKTVAKVEIEMPEPTPTPSPTPSPTPTPFPTPTPTLEPTPTPTPTPVLAEMVLTVSLNKKLIHRGGKIRVNVEVKDTDGNFVEADKVSCRMTRSDGTWLYAVKRNTDKTRFSFKIKPNAPAGRYQITATASKKGYKDAVVEKFFTVK